MKRLPALFAWVLCALLVGCLETRPKMLYLAPGPEHCSAPLGTVRLAPPAAASADARRQMQAGMPVLKKMIVESGCFVPVEEFSAERPQLEKGRLAAADFTLQPTVDFVPATRNGTEDARKAGSDPPHVVVSLTLIDNRSGKSIEGAGRSTESDTLRAALSRAEPTHDAALAAALNQTVRKARELKAIEALAQASGATNDSLVRNAFSSKAARKTSPSKGAAVGGLIGSRPAGQAPTRHVNLDAPNAVRPAQVFSVQVWLSQRKQTPEARTVAPAGQSLTPSGQLVLNLPTDRSEWAIKVALIAPGFEFANDSPNQASITLAAEDSNPALFELRATSGEPGPRTLRATLWHEGAFLGSVTREIEVRPTVAEKTAPVAGSVPSMSLNAVPRGEARAGTFAAKASETARELPSKPSRKADLTVWMVHDDPRRLSPAYVVVASPHMADPAPQRWTFPDDADEWLQAWADRLQRATAANAGVATIRGLGSELYERLAPPELRRVLAELGPAVSTMQIYSNNAAIPWEMMRPGVVGGREVDFLGTSLQLARWPSAVNGQVRERPPQSLLVQELVVMAPDYGGEERLASQRDEVSFLSTLKGYRSTPGTFAGIQGIAQSPPAGIVHFAGHGETTGASAAQRRYQLKLADGPFDSVAWRGLTRPRYPPPSLYFFNACELGSVETQVGAAAGWAPAVLDSGAAGYIGGLWPLRDGPAAHFAKQFYTDMARTAPGAKRMSVAEALRQARNLFYTTGDPTYLAYVFYGDVNLELLMP